jgi:hypothetical protein
LNGPLNEYIKETIFLGAPHYDICNITKDVVEKLTSNNSGKCLDIVKSGLIGETVNFQALANHIYGELPIYGIREVRHATPRRCILSGCDVLIT